MILRRLPMLLCCLAVAWSAAAHSATSDEEQRALREALANVPGPGQPLVVRLPRPKTLRLRNGLRALVLEDHRLPTVAFTMRVRAGSFFELPDKRGLAALTAAMLDEETENRPIGGIAAQVDALGASLSATAEQGGPMAVIHIAGFSEDAETLMKILADIVRRPTFPAEPFEKARRRMVANVARDDSDPNALAKAATLEALYGDTPPARVRPPVSGLDALTPKDTSDFHAACYRPERAILGITGDLRPEEAAHLVERAFGDWKRGTAPPRAALPRYQPARETRVTLVDRPGSVQTVLRLANLGIQRKSADYPAMFVLDHILGGTYTSRLWMNIRETKGYAYSVGSEFTAPLYTGYWATSAQVRNAVTGETVTEFLAEFERLRARRVSPEELEGAKQSIVGRFARQVENPAMLLDHALDIAWYDLPPDYWSRFLKRVQDVSADDVRRVARKYLTHPQIVAVGERAEIEEALTPFGPLTVASTRESGRTPE